MKQKDSLLKEIVHSKKVEAGPSERIAQGP